MGSVFPILVDSLSKRTTNVEMTSIRSEMVRFLNTCRENHQFHVSMRLFYVTTSSDVRVRFAFDRAFIWLTNILIIPLLDPQVGKVK